MDNDIENSTRQIKIMIRTNIPNGEDFIELNKNMLVVSDTSKLSEYPFFSEKFKYPIQILNTYTYEQKVDFFFNEQTFKKLIYANKNVIECYTNSCDICDDTVCKKDKNDVNGEDDNDDDDDNELDTGIDEINIMKCNIETMIGMLFPTKFPAISENINSFCHYIKKEEPNFLVVKGSLDGLTSFIPSLNSEYSYLNIAGSIHTVTKTIWLNDFLNHPKYNKLIKEFIKMKSWIKNVRDEYGFKTNINSYTNKIQDVIKNVENKDIQSNEQILDDTIIINNIYPYPADNSINKGDILKKFKINIRNLFGYSNDDKMTRTISFPISKKSKSKNDEGPLQLPPKTFGGLSNIYNSNKINNDKYKNEENFEFKINSDKYKDEENLEFKINIDKDEDGSKFNIDKTIELIDILTKTIEDNPQFIFKQNTPLYDKFKKIVEYSEKIKELKYAGIYFIEYPDLHFINDKNIEKFKNDNGVGRFNQYEDYINNLENYNDIKIKCYNKILQLAINNYVRKMDSYLNEYLDNLSNLSFGIKTPFPYSKEYFPTKFKDSKFPYFVGITSIDNVIPKYELYLQIDLLKGKLTNENVKLLSCDYKNNELGGILTSKLDNMNMTNSSVVLVNKIYHEIPTEQDKNKDKPIKGGKNKKKTRKQNNKRSYRKTKKNYITSKKRIKKTIN